MKVALPFLILLLGVGAGCVTETQTPAPAQGARVAGPLPPRTTVVDKRVVVEPDLQHLVRLVGVRESTAPEGFMRIQVDVENLSNSLLKFGYRIDWFDEQGQALPLASTSTPWTLLAHETRFLAATAPTPAARDFRVTFVGPGG